MSDFPTLKDLIREKPSSSVPLEKPTTEEVLQIELTKASGDFWKQVGLEYVEAYSKGIAIGRFGDNKLGCEKTFIRLAQTIENIIKNQINDRSESTERLSLHFQLLKSIMTLIGKDLKDRKLDKNFTKEFIAQLHGFIEQYSTIIKEQ